MSRLLIRGGTVLTMGRVNHAEADVLVDGQVITEIGPRLRARDAEVVEAAGAIVMPGFVDAHRHTWESLFRNSGDSRPTAEAVRQAMSADDVYAATTIGLLGAVHAGITTVVDCSPFPEGEHHEAVLQAHRDAGLRTVLVVPPRSGGRGWGRVDPTHGAPVIAARPANPFASTLDAAVADMTSAREAGLRMHAHLEMPDQAGVVGLLGGRGLLGPDVTLVHGSHLDEADLAAAAASGASVVLTPASDMAAGIGSPPLQGLIDAGIHPGLGIDREHLAPGDAFAQMRAVISLQHATVFDRKLAGKAGLPKLLTTRDVIRFGTIAGAAAVGLEAVTGVLEPGRQADLIVLRTDRPNIHPINDPVGAVVWGMDSSNVAWVVAAGRVLKRHGDLVADTALARSLAGAARDRLVGAGAR